MRLPSQESGAAAWRGATTPYLLCPILCVTISAAYTGGRSRVKLYINPDLRTLVRDDSQHLAKIGKLCLERLRSRSRSAVKIKRHGASACGDEFARRQASRKIE